ncbi:replication initiation protein [Bordetella bronchiseptica]|uniref:replication initiation protein n=1 Tax=Bordetella bronchiseptica TaxID=518 RepID=UPI0039939C7D
MRRPLAEALTLPYLQLNRTSLASWLIFDVDRPGAASAWDDGDLPVPTYVSTNPTNGHSHLGYAVSSPVCLTEAGRDHPRRYLAAIEHAYVARLRADSAFNGPLGKNPLHPRWVLWEPASCPTYELGLLAEYVDLPSSIPRSAHQEGYSRNCDLFQALLHWAVREIRNFWGESHNGSWREACIQQALALNRFEKPLGVNEVVGIGRSVARWTWVNTTPKGFQETQSIRGRRGGMSSGAARWAASAGKREIAQALAETGLSNRAIAAQLGVSHPTVGAWLSGK